MAKILMLVSSAKSFIAAGAEVLVATADGQTPHPDPYGLEYFFHYPDEDEVVAAWTQMMNLDRFDVA